MNNRVLRGSVLVIALSSAACGGSDDSAGGGTGGSGGAAGSGGTSGSGGAAGGGAGGATGGAAGSGGGPCTLGTSWTQVDQVSSPDASLGATAITVDENDTIYVAGSEVVGSVTTQRVRKSNDAGATWQDAGTFAPSFRGITTSGSNLFVGGLAFVNPGGLSHSVMLRSPDGAATFEQVDDFFVDDTNPCWGWNVASGTDGAVYGSGWCFAASGSRWIVRKSADQGTSWSNALDLPGGGSAVVVIAVSAGNEVYVAGQHSGGWHVHRQNADGEWSASDDYTLAAGKGGRPTHLRALSRVYALGVAPDASDILHWIVRRLDGDTWTTVDDLAAAIASQLGGASGVHEGENGTILVTHSVPDASDVVHAITRRSNDDGATWQTMDDYQLASGKPTVGGALAADSNGNVYAVLEGMGASDKGHWLVRKLACQ